MVEKWSWRYKFGAHSSRFGVPVLDLELMAQRVSIMTSFFWACCDNGFWASCDKGFWVTRVFCARCDFCSFMAQDWMQTDPSSFSGLFRDSIYKPSYLTNEKLIFLGHELRIGLRASPPLVSVSHYYSDHSFCSASIDVITQFL